jgi:PAS domain S-box-containing protein
MAEKPTYEELEQRVRELEKEAVERRRAQDALKDYVSFQSVLAVLRGVKSGQAESMLLQTFVSEIVKEYGFCMAWYGQYANGEITPVLSAGRVDRYLDNLVLQIREPTSPDAQCAMSQAIIKGSPFSYADLEKDEGFRRWRDYALELGYRSNLALPVTVDGQVEGGVMVYADTPNAFPEARMERLQLLTLEIDAILGECRRMNRAEQSLWESEDRYRRLTEAITDYIYTVTIQDGLAVKTVHGPACVAVTGHTAEDFRANPYLWIQMVHEEDQAVVQQQAERILSGQDAQPIEHRIFRKDGSMRWVINTLVPRHDPNGTLLSYDGLVRDIHERKCVEEVLRKSEARYRSVVEDQTELICRFLPDGILTFVNEAYCQFFSKKPEELIGHSFMPLIPEEDQETVRKQFNSLSPETPVVTYEHRVVMPDGQIAWQLWSDRAIFDEQRRLIEFQAVGRDITQRVQAEEAVQRSSEEIKLFAYSVSHDLKSPAIGIYGLTKRLCKHYGDALGEKGRIYCDQVLKAAEQIAALVEMINVYISSKETPLHIERVKLKEIFEMARDEFSTQVNIRQIRWSEPHTMPEIKADRLSILRILRNLVDNALKYGGDDLSEIELGYRGSDEFHIVCVSNDGVTVRQEDFERICGPFQRNETARGIEGTGLGLAIVKALAARHDGKVWVESRREKGTSFYVSISRSL